MLRRDPVRELGRSRCRNRCQARTIANPRSASVMEEVDESVIHRPVVDEGPECIALIVTEAPLKFRTWMARLAQPLIGI